MSTLGMDKEDVVHIYDGILLSHQKKEITMFATTWMDLEIVILSKSDWEAEILHGIPYMWNLKRHDTHELTHKTKTDSPAQRMNLWLLEGRMGRRDSQGVLDGQVTLLYLKQITNKDLLYTTGKSAPCYLAAWMGRELEGECIYICVWLSPCAVHLKLCQYC